jgi:RNA polymerase sigma-70 factor (ECF subfamily)
MQEPSDGELMARVQAGDAAACARLVDRYKERVFGYLVRLTGSRARADDLAQETFLRLYLHAGEYREQGKLAGWLYRTATNLVRSEERRALRFRCFLGRVVTEESAPSHESALLAEEARRTLQAALARLPLRYRAPLVLHTIEERSFEEIAHILGLPEGTVKSRISRARGRLRVALEPFMNESPAEPLAPACSRRT